MDNDRKTFGGRVIDIVLLTTIVTLLVFITIFAITSKEFKFQKFIASEEVTAVSPEKKISSVLQDTKTSYPGIRIVSETFKDNSHSFNINYPKTNSQIVNDEITKYIAESKQRFENLIRLKSTVEDNQNIKADLKITTEIHEHQKKYYSFVLTKYVAIDTDQYDTTVKTIFYNSETGKIIDIRTVLNNNAQSLVTLSKKARSEISSNKLYQQFVVNESLFAATEPKWENYERFAIKNNSLILYYNKGQIADRSIGTPTVSFTLSSSIYDLLAAEFQAGIVKDVPKPPPAPPKEQKPSSGKKVALTFDDGPHKTFTTQILDTLDKYDAKATFFMLGNLVEHYPSIVEDVYNRGHEIGNHTWNHSRLVKLSKSGVQEQINLTNNAIKNITGQYPTLFRPPYGEINNTVDSLISLPTIKWTVDTQDWKYHSSSKLLSMVKENVHNNAIILMHDIHQSTADGLDSVLAYLQKQGYEFVTVSELLQDK